MIFMQIHKIITQEEKERRETKNKRIMGIILGIIMLFSTAGYFVFDFSSGKTNSLEYGQYKFKQNQNGYWTFSYANQEYQTLFTPFDTVNISRQMTRTLSEYYNIPLYISAQPIEDISASATQEILRNIQNSVDRVNYACLDENCSQNYPVKSCLSDNILVFKQSTANSSSIKQDKRCVIIFYTASEEEKVADAFLFSLLGIQ
jgi:hypothetical protein